MSLRYVQELIIISWFNKLEGGILENIRNIPFLKPKKDTESVGF